MPRFSIASVAFAIVLLAGCASGPNGEPPAPPAQSSEPSQPSTTASPIPTATPIQPPARLPSQVTGPPLWAAPGELVAAFPGTVVTLTSDQPAVLTGTAPDGTQRWSAVLQQPSDLDGQAELRVLRLRGGLGVVWSGSPADGGSGSPSNLSILDAATGQEAARPRMPADAHFVGQRSLDSIDVQVGEQRKVVTLGDGGKVSVSDSKDVDGLAPVARVENEDRIGSAPVQGPVQTTGVFVVNADLAVRQFRTLSGDQKVYYQVVDTAKSRAVAPATVCPDFRSGKTQPVATGHLSPSAATAGIGQAVVYLDSGHVTCLATLSQDLQTAPTVLADDGSAFGATRSGTFYVDASGKGFVDTDGAVLPIALLQDVAVFASADERGVLAYRR